MIKINYTAKNFNYPYTINGDGSTLEFKWSDLIRAAETVGKRNNRDVYQYGLDSYYEWLFRRYVIMMNLSPNTQGHLTKTDLYINADPSEKTAFTYFIGNTITKLFAEKLLNIPWLMHLDVYKEDLNPIMRDARKRKPDFIGIDQHDQRNNYIIIESKGRGSKYDEELMETAKGQTRHLRTINSEFPNLRAAIQSYYEGNCLKAKLEDPPEYDEDAADIPLDLEKYIQEYYHIFLNKNENELTEETINQQEFLVFKSSPMHSKLGIHKNVYDSIKYRSPSKTNFEIDEFELFRLKIDAFSDETRSIGKDGIYLELSHYFMKDKYIF